MDDNNTHVHSWEEYGYVLDEYGNKVARSWICVCGKVTTTPWEEDNV